MDFDNCISVLVDKLRRKQTLEVMFGFMLVPPDRPRNFKGFLPKFREKSRVRIVDLFNEQDLELVVCFSLHLFYDAPLTRIPVKSTGRDA